jgi:hypothetical protein
MSEKQKLQQMIQQKDPVKEQAQQLQFADAEAKIGKTQAETQKLGAEAGKAQTASLLNMAKVRTEGMPEGGPEPKSDLDIAEQLADINEKNATAMHKRATSAGIEHKALMTPLQLIAEHTQRSAERSLQDAHQTEDRLLDHHHRNADRIFEDFHRNKDREVQRQQAANRLSTPSGA